MNVYSFIEAEQAGRRSVKRACELMKVSRSAYYQHIRGQQSQRTRVDAQLTEQITTSTLSVETGQAQSVPVVTQLVTRQDPRGLGI